MKLKARIQSKGGYKIVFLNRRKAIRERCLNCCGWSEKEVKECHHENDCSLFLFRTGVGKQNPEARATAIRAYCYLCCNNSRYEIYNCPNTDCSLWAYRKSKIDITTKIDSKQKFRYIEVSAKKKKVKYISEHQF